MKPKQSTTSKKQESDYKVALRDCQNEFEDVLGDDFLDEEALCMAMAEVEDE